MPYKLLDDKKTYANVNSENPTVCFLHGWGRSSQDFNSISQSFDYISFDLPGFGKSLEPINSMTPKEYADYINQYIPNSVDTIVGHSFGGRIAVHLSELRDVRNLILVGVPLIKKQIHSKKLSILNIYKSLNKFGILSDQMIEKIKNSNLHILEGKGHNPLNSSYLEIVNIINLI